MLAFREGTNILAMLNKFQVDFLWLLILASKSDFIAICNMNVSLPCDWVIGVCCHMQQFVSLYIVYLTYLGRKARILKNELVNSRPWLGVRKPLFLWLTTYFRSLNNTASKWSPKICFTANARPIMFLSIFHVIVWQLITKHDALLVMKETMQYLSILSYNNSNDFSWGLLTGRLTT